MVSEARPAVAYARLMAAAVLCMVMFGAVLVVPPVCLDAIGTELGMSYERRGLLITIRMAALIVSLLVVGRFGEGAYKRHYLFWGLTGIGVAQVMGARAEGYGALLGAMVVSGLGKGVVEALVNPLVAQLHPTGSARALNLVNGLFSVGLVVGALSTGQLLEAGYSWRLPFWLWAVPPVLCGVLFMTPNYPAVEGRGQEEPRGEFRRFLGLPLFWVLVAAMVVSGGCEAGLTSWAPNFVNDVLGASALGGAWTTVLYGTAMAVGRFSSGWLVGRVGAVRLMMFSAAGCGLATGGLAMVDSLTGAWALFALGGLFVACFWPTLLSVASDQISVGSTSLFALLAAAGVGGCVLFPWAIGALGDAFGLRAGILVLPASMVLMVGLLVAGTRYLREGSVM